MFYTKRARYDFPDFVLAAYSYVVVLDSPWKPITPETISDQFGTGEYSLDEDISSLAGEHKELEPDEYESLQSFVQAGEALEEMVTELFGVSSSDLDMPKVKARFDHNSPAEVLSELGRSYIKNIESRIRFDKSGSRLKLRDIADTAYDARKALHDMDGQYQKDVVEDVRTDLADISLERVRETVNKLETYDEVNPDTMESLKRFVAVDDVAVEDAVTAADNAARLRQLSGLEEVQATLMSVKLKQTDVYQRFTAVQLEGGSGGTGALGERFQKVGEHYVR